MSKRVVQSNGRPEAEVIVQFQDGLSYNKARMTTALETVMANKPDSKKEVIKFKKDDVDFIVQEFEIPRTQAEKALVASDHDLKKALQALITRKL